LTTRIGGKVTVRFPAAWAIYSRYVIMRVFGSTQAEIMTGENFLNYDITWDDAERLFKELSNDAPFSRETSELLVSFNRVTEEAMKVASSI
jgi:hypothetical protein